MSFDVSALSNYTKQNAKSIISRQLMSAQTADIISKGGVVLTEVKSSEKIGAMETDAIFQDGGSCGFTPQGTTRFSQREIVVGRIKVQESLCLADLEAKYTQAMLTAGAQYDDLADFSFNQFWIDRKIAQTGVALERAIWQGNKASVDGQLNKFEGFIKLLHNAGGVVQANAPVHLDGGVALTELNASNILKAMDALFKATPVEILDAEDLTYFVGSDVFRLVKLAIRNSNYFNFVPEKDKNVIYVPGSDMKIQRVNGLNAQQKIFGMRISNMVLGTDLLDDATEVKVRFDENNETVDYSSKFKYGVNVGFTEEVVEFAI